MSITSERLIEKETTPEAAAKEVVIRLLDFLECTKKPFSLTYPLTFVLHDPRQSDTEATYHALMYMFGVEHPEVAKNDQIDANLGPLTYEDTVYRDKRGKITRTVTSLGDGSGLEVVELLVHKALPATEQLGELMLAQAGPQK